MNLEKRLLALESGGAQITEHVTLHFADGRTRQIPGEKHLIDLLLAANGGAKVTSIQRQHLDWARKCVAATKGRSGRLVEVLRIALHGPAISPDRQMNTGERR